MRCDTWVSGIRVLEGTSQDMVLDTTTLRIAFGLMALMLVVLFYSSAYRVTRSPYSGWWCVALLFFRTGSASFLLNGTGQQIWPNPLGNCAARAGSGGSVGRHAP